MRISGVKLVADVGEYKRNVRDAAGETDKLKASIDRTGLSSKTTGQSVDDLGGDLRDTGRDARALKAEIREVEGRLHSLAQEFAATGDAAARLDITKSIRKQQGELRQLLKVDKLLPQPGEVQQGGRRLGSMIADFAGKGIEAGSMSPHLTAALAAGAVAAAPLIGATVSAAVLGGVGFGGIAGGLTLAAKDQRVVDAAKRVAAQVGDQLGNAALPMVHGAIEALDQVRLSARRMDTDLRRIFAGSAQNLDPLTRGLTGMVERLVPSIRRAVEGAGPIFDMLGDALPELGDAVGDVLDMLSDNGPEAAAALHVVLDVIGFVIRQTGATINLLTEMFGLAAKWGLFGVFSGKIRADIDGLREASEGADGAADGAGGSFDKFMKAVEGTGAAAKQVGPPFESLYDAIRRIAGVNISAAEAALDLADAFTEASGAIDKKTKVSADEKRALLSLATTMNSTTEALDAQGRSTVEATKAHESNRKKLIETAIKMGYTRGEAVKLANQYIATPKGVTTDIDQPGMKKSREETLKYHKQLNDLTRKIKTHVSVEGDKAAYAKLERLLVAQQAAKKGISVSAAQSAFNKNAKGFHGGGRTADVGEHEPAGIVHGKEVVFSAATTKKIDRQAPGFIDQVLATGQLPGYAAGGRVLDMPFRVNAAMTKVISMAEALSKVAPSFGNWPSSPGAQRGDSGVWRKVLQLIRSGPRMGSFGNAYRPGDPLWHGSGRAVDWMGYNMDPLARYLAAKRPLELIHRTRSRDYAYTRGRNRGSFNEGLMNAHRNHIHIAMQNGGTINEPVVGVGRSGASYSFAETGPERVLTPAQTAAGGGAGGVTTVTLAPTIHINGSNLSPQQIAAAVNRELGAQFNQLSRGV